VLATLFRLWMTRFDRKKSSAAGTAIHPSFTKLKKDLAAMIGLILAGGLIMWILIVDGITDITYRMAFELQPLYMENLMGLSKTQIGWLTSIASIVTILCITPSGWLADKKGERSGIIIGILFYVFGMASFVLAGNYTESGWQLRFLI
jgi:MFS family permease